MTEQARQMQGVFPIPVYGTQRDSNLSPKEEKEIEDIIEEGMYKNYGNFTSTNTYIFNDKLKNIKQFCEQQIKSYVEQVICPKKELDFYITQSWLNIIKPGGEYHHKHTHVNSVISGVFYISTEEDDKITFTDPNLKIKEAVKFDDPKEYNMWNSTTWWYPSITSELVLFPSWLEHQVDANEGATTDRISLSFNTFVRGTVGNKTMLTELVLK